MTSTSDTNYDPIAERYLSEIEQPLSWNNRYERPYMLGLLGDLRGKRVLDLGCGSGFYSEVALRLGATVTAVDASERMLTHVRSKLHSENLRLIKADLAERLPMIPGASQDVAICSLVLHYLRDWDTVLSEIERVLAAAGEVHISTHHPFADYLLLKKASYFEHRLVEDQWGGSNPYCVHYYTRSLADVMKAVLASRMTLTRVHEPIPPPELHAAASKQGSTSEQQPGLLFLSLRKEP